MYSNILQCTLTVIVCDMRNTVMVRMAVGIENDHLI
jgi:hypothetical protein